MPDFIRNHFIDLNCNYFRNFMDLNLKNRIKEKISFELIQMNWIDESYFLSMFQYTCKVMTMFSSETTLPWAFSVILCIENGFSMKKETLKVNCQCIKSFLNFKALTELKFDISRQKLSLKTTIEATTNKYHFFKIAFLIFDIRY